MPRRPQDPRALAATSTRSSVRIHIFRYPRVTTERSSRSSFPTQPTPVLLQLLLVVLAPNPLLLPTIAACQFNATSTTAQTLSSPPRRNPRHLQHPPHPRRHALHLSRQPRSRDRLLAFGALGLSLRKTILRSHAPERVRPTRGGHEDRRADS